MELKPVPRHDASLVRGESGAAEAQARRGSWARRMAVPQEGPAEDPRRGAHKAQDREQKAGGAEAAKTGTGSDVAVSEQSVEERGLP